MTVQPRSYLRYVPPWLTKRSRLAEMPTICAFSDRDIEWFVTKPTKHWISTSLASKNTARLSPTRFCLLLAQKTKEDLECLVSQAHQWTLLPRGPDGLSHRLPIS